MERERKRKRKGKEREESESEWKVSGNGKSVFEIQCSQIQSRQVTEPQERKSKWGREPDSGEKGSRGENKEKRARGEAREG